MILQAKIIFFKTFPFKKMPSKYFTTHIQMLFLNVLLSLRKLGDVLIMLQTENGRRKQRDFILISKKAFTFS